MSKESLRESDRHIVPNEPRKTSSFNEGDSGGGGWHYESQGDSYLDQAEQSQYNIPDGDGSGNSTMGGDFTALIAALDQAALLQATSSSATLPQGNLQSGLDQLNLAGNLQSLSWVPGSGSTTTVISDAASQHVAATDGAVQTGDAVKDFNLSSIISMKASDLKDGQVIKAEIGGKTVEIMVRVADLGDGTKAITFSNFAHPDQEARINVSTDNKEASHVLISLRVDADGGGFVRVSHPRDIGVGFQASDGWHISEVTTPAMSSAGDPPAKGNPGGSHQPDSPPAKGGQSGPDDTPAPPGPGPESEVPGPDGRTDSEIRAELEARGHASYGQLVMDMGRGPLDPNTVPPRFTEWALEHTGRLHPQPVDPKEPDVFDEVFREHPTQENRYIRIGVTGPESKIAAEKADGDERVRQAYLQGIALGLLGARRGAASDGLVKPAPEGRFPEKPPPGFSLNEMREINSRLRYFPDAFEPAPKQPGADFVDGAKRRQEIEHTVSGGQVRVRQTIKGGEWIQGKRLMEESKSSPEKLVRQNVSNAVKKFYDPVRNRESIKSTTMSDGTKYTSELRDPDSLRIHIEVPPELTGMNPETLAELQRSAEAELGLWTDPKTGMYEGVPIRVEVVPTP
ncbi:hypothetical protein [Streptomyces sp. 3211]|uniref:hypothetical protein n=1 Tax=Streptomyces sp. 3211 TaxID=1964449 RepID=UPI001331185A|nr:hypothetical protein [Streptomyces sp. 3211]